MYENNENLCEVEADFVGIIFIGSFVTLKMLIFDPYQIFNENFKQFNKS